MITLYVDGACKGNPGPGGWGVIMIDTQTERQLNGFHPSTTNNRMELQAAIEGLTTLADLLPPGLPNQEVHIHTDSQYVKNGITTWLISWKKRGWKTAGGDVVKNQDLWEKLDALHTHFHPTWHWVKGHAGHDGNEKADQQAKLGLQRGLIEGQQHPLKFH